MFDPNQPLPDFQVQNAAIQRQRAIAEFLRKQASAPQPQGQMVGKRFIAPSLLQYLPGLMQQYDAGQISRQADSAEKQYGADVTAAKDSWASSLPRAVAAVPGRSALAGPPDASGSPELAAVAPSPARLPDRASVLSSTMAGMRIPGNEKAAELWNKGMSDEWTREDNQQARTDAVSASTLARRDNLEAQRAADSDRRKADIEQRERESVRRSEDTRLSIEQRREAAAEAAAARRDIASLVAATAANKADKPAALKNLPAAQAKAWIENTTGIASVDNALDIAAARPKSFGAQHYVLPDAITQRTDPEGVAARAAVANLGSLRIHDRSGAAVTAAETPRLKPFIPSAGDNHETVVVKLTGFRREYEIIQREILEYADTQGYKHPGVLKERTPRVAGSNPPPAASKPPPGLVLPPGATYIGPAQ